jgi:hypothetical protein
VKTLNQVIKMNLIELVYIKNQPLKVFAKQADIPYSTSMRMRNRSLERLRDIIGATALFYRFIIFF